MRSLHTLASRGVKITKKHKIERILVHLYAPWGGYGSQILLKSVPDPPKPIKSIIWGCFFDRFLVKWSSDWQSIIDKLWVANSHKKQMALVSPKVRSPGKKKEMAEYKKPGAENITR